MEADFELIDRSVRLRRPALWKSAALEVGGSARCGHAIEVTPADYSHLEAIVSIETECFSEPWSPFAFLSELNNPNSVIFVALAQGHVIGFINANFVLDEAYINNIAVAKAWQGRGVGKRLLEEAISLSKSRNCAFVSLEVRESNQAASALYASKGFIPVGRRKRYYHNPVEDAVIMTLKF